MRWSGAGSGGGGLVNLIVLLKKLISVGFSQTGPK
jgi:hypothetical protein